LCTDVDRARAAARGHVWGGLFLIATQFVRTTAGVTAAGIAFARTLAQ
jgi:hypothetical protein